jgi:hypothetical protein
VTCSIVASLSAWRRAAWKTPFPAAASLLSDITFVAETRLLCRCTSACLVYQQIYHNLYIYIYIYIYSILIQKETGKCGKNEDWCLVQASRTSVTAGIVINFWVLIRGRLHRFLGPVFLLVQTRHQYPSTRLSSFLFKTGC